MSFVEKPLNSEDIAPVPTGGLVPLVADAEGVMHWSAAISGVAVPDHTHSTTAGQGGQLTPIVALTPVTGMGAAVLQTNPEIASPTIGEICGGEGEIALGIGNSTASDENYINVLSGAAGSPPTLNAQGSGDVNISVNVVPFGTGTLQQNGVPVATTTDAQTLTNKTFPNTELHVQSLDPAFDLILKPGDTLTADRTLSLFVSDADAALVIAGPGTALISGSNTGNQTITLTGDVTGSGGGSFAATIAADSVTFAKMLNSTAASVLVGRGSASGAGDFQEITLGSGLSMAGTVLSSSGAYTDEQAQDAVGAMVDGSLTYVDATPLLQRAALTGDVTAGAGSNATTIAADAVTLAKMANMATASLIYRKTAGTGDPEVNTLATLKTDLGLTGTNSGDQTVTLTGDVTGSGTGSFAATIASAAVTMAKMANIATQTVIGRGDAGAGVPSALTFSDTGIAVSTGEVLSVSGRLLNIQFLSSGTTYTPTTGTTAVVLFGQAGGSGGGGAAQAAVSSAGGSGGGSGGWFIKRFTGVTGTYTYAIGAGGAGGAAGANNGTVGGDTTFVNGGTTYTAKGATGGTGAAAGTVGAFFTGGAGGTVSLNGDMNSGGSPGQGGVRLTGTVSSAGLGGTSPFGGGGLAATTERAGFDGTGFGSGGGGGNCLGTTAKAGGDGKGGLLIIHEYSA